MATRIDYRIHKSDKATPAAALAEWREQNPDANLALMVSWKRERIEVTPYNRPIHEYADGRLVLTIPITVPVCEHTCDEHRSYR